MDLRAPGNCSCTGPLYAMPAASGVSVAARAIITLTCPVGCLFQNKLVFGRSYLLKITVIWVQGGLNFADVFMEGLAYSLGGSLTAPISPPYCNNQFFYYLVWASMMRSRCLPRHHLCSSLTISRISHSYGSASSAGASHFSGLLLGGCPGQDFHRSCCSSCCHSRTSEILKVKFTNS